MEIGKRYFHSRRFYCVVRGELDAVNIGRTTEVIFLYKVHMLIFELKSKIDSGNDEEDVRDRGCYRPRAKNSLLRFTIRRLPNLFVFPLIW